MFYCNGYLHSAITEVVCADVTRRKVESNIIKIAQNDKMEKQEMACNISPSVSVLFRSRKDMGISSSDYNNNNFLIPISTSVAHITL